jgi:pimeloyl-ACP methyl ester carboxylesterase
MPPPGRSQTTTSSIRLASAVEAARLSRNSPRERIIAHCPQQPDVIPRQVPGAVNGTAKLAADIRDLIHERGAQSALLAGHGWGGSVAWATAMNHPEVVDRRQSCLRLFLGSVSGSALIL